MNDWARVKSKNKEKLERLNLPKFSPELEIMILDEHCPYSLDDIIDIEPYKEFDKDDYGMHGTMAGQVIKVIAKDKIKFYGAGWEGTEGLRNVIEFCIENNIKIISASINFSYSKEREEILKTYYDWGGIFVTTAGNKDNRGIKYPGRSPYTICVSATNSPDCDGKEIDVTSDSYWYVRNKNKGYFTPYNGTSCSGPVDTGCIAYIVYKYSDWNCEDVRQFLINNSTTDMKSLEKYEKFFSFPDGFTIEEVESMDYFKDDNGKWHEKFNNRLAEKGIVNGYVDGTIRPEDTIKRGEVNKIVSEAIDFVLEEVSRMILEKK